MTSIEFSRRPWTPQEDELLLSLVSELGLQRWCVVASKLQGRSGKQCCERYKNQLSPEIVKDPWSKEEDLAIVAAQAQVGNKWTEIANALPGRTGNAVKNRWNWMMSPKREDILNTIVTQNTNLFRAIYQETSSRHDAENTDSDDEIDADADPLLAPSPCDCSSSHRRLLRALLAARAAEPVERPLASRNSCGGFGPLCFDRAGPLVRSSERWTCSWARLFTQRLWTFGYQEQALASIFDALPAGFCAAIQTAADRLQGHMQTAHAKRIADAAAAAAGGGGDA
eukprot:CAMPEP_0172173754 /NCGR_PEP_ID=MMETSP1050-20130122/13258_1 /TAXON_ID=233186 /ORGANISM="Cryptomonas curvata, Strain CCAP979/52" /LENGTH=282 /DNA_ID=CAMNT_0012845601 /DNA_START=172 /DNA_END=1017 /DNA_ORIENTATION=+